MKAQRELEFKVWNLTEEDISNKTLFDLLGKEFVVEKFTEAFKKMGVLTRYDEFYLNKIGKRTVENYISTLREINGQVGTRLYKVEHNALITGLLREAEIIDGTMFAALYPNFMNKITIAAHAHWGLLLRGTDFGNGKDHLIYKLKGVAGIANTEQSKLLGVPMGHWEGGREKITKLKRRKDSK
ncbi:hypothetical protein vBAbaPP1_139 [Acinetobacter phage vB_AbaM_P1]|nr:hypothetical protein vBAbaPP1_139 [Acinetobacter phage vB_AbaM_P1]